MTLIKSSPWRPVFVQQYAETARSVSLGIADGLGAVRNAGRNSTKLRSSRQMCASQVTSHRPDIQGPESPLEAKANAMATARLQSNDGSGLQSVTPNISYAGLGHISIAGQKHQNYLFSLPANRLNPRDCFLGYVTHPWVSGIVGVVKKWNPGSNRMSLLCPGLQFGDVGLEGLGDGHHPHRRAANDCQVILRRSLRSGNVHPWGGLESVPSWGRWVFETNTMHQLQPRLYQIPACQNTHPP